MGDWGYGNRADLPDRVIPASPTAQPRGEWPHGVADATKRRGNTALRVVQHVLHCDGVQFYGGIGLAAQSQSTTITETSEGWFSEVGRFCRLIEVTNSAGALTYRFHGVQITLSPLTWLDPDEPYVPAIMRFEDVVACRLVGPSAGETGFMHFGITSVSGSGLTNQPRCLVGFAVSMNETAYGNWRAVCVNGTGGSTVDGGVGLDEDLGVSSELPHRLTLEIDGSTKAVRYYIDGQQLYEHLPTDADLGTVSIFEMQHRWNIGVQGGASIKAGIWMDGQAVISTEVVDEAA